MFDRGDGRKMGATSSRHTSHRFQLALGTPSRRSCAAIAPTLNPQRSRLNFNRHCSLFSQEQQAKSLLGAQAAILCSVVDGRVISGTQTFLSVRQTGIPACFFLRMRVIKKSSKK
jgi:hypothetical protein